MSPAQDTTPALASIVHKSIQFVLQLLLQRPAERPVRADLLEGIIVLIRTVLDFFLSKELRELQE